MKKGANLMVRHDQQIDASNFGYFIFGKAGELFNEPLVQKGHRLKYRYKMAGEGVQFP